MKDQHTKQTRSVVLSITAILLMLVISVMGFTAIVSADQEQWPAEKIGVENFLPGTGMSFDEETGSFTKEYDGTADAKLTVNTQNNKIGIIPESVVAVFVDKDGGETSNVADATHIKVTYELADENVAAESLLLDAKITPSNDLVYTVTYNPYGIKTNGKNVTLTGVGGQSVTATLVGDLGVLDARADAYTGTGIVATNLSNPNYDPSAISVIVNRLEITGVDGKDKWDYGSTTTLFAEGADGVDYPATLVFTDLFNKAAWEKGDAGNYSLTLTSNYVWAEGASSTVNANIYSLKIKVTPDTSVILGDGKNIYLPKLNLELAAQINEEFLAEASAERLAELLAEALESITYKVDGQTFTGATYGDYTVIIGTENNNFAIADKEGIPCKDGIMEVALKIRYESKTFEVVDEKTNEVVGIIILKSSGTEGFTDAVTVTAQSIKGYPKIVKSKYNMTYKISISGAEDGQTFTVYVPLNDDVMAPRTEGLENGLYLYEEATGKLVAAKNAKLGDGYAEFAEVAGSVTLVIAPDYNAPFFQTVWGILLIVVLVLGLIALMCYIGLRLRRELETAEAPAMVIDTVGELPETEEAAAEETAEVDETAVLEETVEEIAESVEEATEEAVDEADEALNAVVEEVLDQLMAEAAEETLDEATEEVIEEVVATAAEEAIEEVAEEVVEEAAEEVVEAAAEEVVEEAAEEVVEEAAEEVVEEAAEEVVEAAAEEVVEAAEETDDESDEDDDNSDDSNDDADGDDAVEAVSMVGEEATFGFGAGADLATFIDVKENPEAYQEMLAREARGEIKIVYRYKKSFQSKLAQSMGNVQDYYSELKNALLSFKGVKNRLSWNYEAFNKGRAHVAKMDAKSKTLYLYLALDPAQFADTKYSVVDVSAKRKYATTPTLIKIKGERKFKHALELIEKVCGEQMTLEKVEAENVDYRVARMTIEEMVDAGLMKQSAGYIVLPTEEV